MCKTPQEIIFEGPEMDPLCITGTVIENKVNGAMQSWADSVTQWMGETIATVLKALTTSWTGIGTPGIVQGNPANNQVSSTVGFLQGSVAGLAGVVLLVSLIAAMAKMVMQNKAEAGVAAFHGMLRFILVSGAGVAVIGALVFITDAFSTWIIDRASGADFGKAIAQMMLDTGGLVFLLYLLIGGIGVLVMGVQIVLLLIRGGALVALAGTLGFSAAMATTDTGKAMFQKHVAWIVAFLLYKPAAAIIYATAFKLMSEQTFGFDDTKTVEHLAGMTLLILAVIALPAMIRLVSPLSEQMASGKGMGGMLAGAAAIAIPTGAMMAKGASGASSGGGAGGGSSGAGGGGGGPAGGGGGGGATGGESAGSAVGASSSGGGGGGGSSGADPAHSSPNVQDWPKVSAGAPGQPSPFKWGGTSTSPKST